MRDTLAKALQAEGYELTRHYRDRRTSGWRHKISVRRKDYGNFDIDTVRPVVRKYAPFTEFRYSPFGATFVYFQKDGTPTPAIGTDFYTRRRLKYRRRKE